MMTARNLLFIVALAAGTVSAQTAPSAPPLVRIDVSAVDADGLPVKDLKADDLKVTDQSKEQRILFFKKNDGILASVPLGAHEYTNQRMEGEPNPTAILVDLKNLSQTDRILAWHRLMRELPKLKTGESTFLYILTLEGTVQAIHPIGPPAADDKTWPQQTGPLDKAMKSLIHTPPAGTSDEDTVKKTYVALETLGNQLSALPGRRNIVWITDQVPNVWNEKNPCPGDWVECALYVPHLSVTLDHANVAVDPLSYTPSPNSAHDMDLLAGLTGGRTYAEEDIDKVLDRVAVDAAGSYTIAYDPSAENWDTKFHRVHVTTDRKAKLVWKQRYYAIPDTRPVTARQQGAALAAFQSPFDMSDIGIRAIVTPAAAPAKGVHLQLQIQTADVMFREDAGKFAGGLILLLSDRGPSGPLGDPSVSDFTLNLTPEQHAAALKGGIPVVQDHPLKDGTQKVRVIVLDQNSSVVGSLTVPAS